MKKTKIDFLPNYRPGSCYASDGVLFSWLGVPRKNVFPQITAWHGCRETFASEIRRYVSPNENWAYNRSMDLRRMRFACIRKYSNKIADDTRSNKNAYNLKWFSNSKRLLNLFEKRLGWGLTTVYRVSDSAVTGANADIFVFSGSAKWMRSPQLMSLYLLILRVARHAPFYKLTNLDNFEEWKTSIARSSNTDVGYFRTVSKFLFPILDNHKELFFRRAIKTAYSGQSGWNGINNMIGGGGDEVTKRRFKKLKANLK